MLESLLALPLGAALEVVLFLLLYRVTPMNGRQAALVVALLSLAGLMIDAFMDWPGADVLAMYVAVLLVTAYLLGILAHAREQRKAQPGQGGRWFHWGPTLIILFFVTLFAVDGLFVVVSRQGLPKPLAEYLLPKQSQSVFPGVVARDFQKKEAQYNAYLEQVRKQRQRGWRVSKGWLVAPRAGEPQDFQVRVEGADGAPVRFAEVGGVFQRPSDSRMDQAFELHEIEPGLYRGRLSLPAPGHWDLVLRIRRGEQLHEIHATTSVAARGKQAGPEP